MPQPNLVNNADSISATPQDKLPMIEGHAGVPSELDSIVIGGSIMLPKCVKNNDEHIIVFLIAALLNDSSAMSRATIKLEQLTESLIGSLLLFILS